MSDDLLRQLDKLAELSGRELQTSAFLRDYISKNYKDISLFNEWGFYSFSFQIDFSKPGKTILFRTDIDAIDSGSGIAKHLCGHHGHMTAMLNLVSKLYSRRGELCGKAVFFFQSAEETGQGAAKALDNGLLDHYNPDYVLAWHNIPGFPLNQILVRDGTFAKSSLGLKLIFNGKMAHASNPSSGVNPAFILPELIGELQTCVMSYSDCMYTLTHIQVGDCAFGISPGHAEVWLTLRSSNDSSLEAFVRNITGIASELSLKHGLIHIHSSHEVFPATVNDSGLVSILKAAGIKLGLEIFEPEVPFPWSEDFGYLGKKVPALLFGLGAGKDTPGLHEKDYRFPVNLVVKSAEILEELFRQLQANAQFNSFTVK